MGWRDKLKMLYKNNTESDLHELESEKMNENDSTNEVEDLKMATKKRVIYLAMDANKKAILDVNNEFIFSHIIEEGDSLDWDWLKEKGMDPKKIRVFNDFKVELDDSKIIRKTNGGKNTRPAKEDAKGKLMKMYEEYEKKNNNDVAEEKQPEEQNIAEDDNRKESTVEEVVKEKGIENACRQQEESEAVSVKAVHEATAEIIAKIENTEQKICEDVANVGDDLAEVVSTKLEKPINKFEKSIDGIEQNLQRNIKNLSEKLSDAEKVLKHNQEHIKSDQESILAKEKTILKKVEQINELCEVTEVLEGKLNKLDQIDAVISLLSDKGVEISREFPPICEEEEDIINLVRYSKKITEQLGYAARDLIRKRAAFESREQNIANEQKIAEEKRAEAYDAGMKKGKLDVINALLGKYTDIDTIIESDIEHVHVIWSLLKELGVEYDGDGYFKKGNSILFGADEVEKMSAIYKKFDGEGSYKVVKSGLVYNGEIVFKAEFEKEEVKMIKELQDVNEAVAEEINE